MGKKAFIKTAGFQPAFFLDEHGGSRCPEDLFGSLVLPFIFLYLIKHATLAKRVSIAINKSARCTGMFEMCTLIIRPYLWCCSPDERVALHQVYHRHYPSR